MTEPLQENAILFAYQMSSLSIPALRLLFSLIVNLIISRECLFILWPYSTGPTRIMGDLDCIVGGLSSIKIGVSRRMMQASL